MKINTQQKNKNEQFVGEADKSLMFRRPFLTLP